jgi:ribosome maturation factor RimP
MSRAIRESGQPTLFYYGCTAVQVKEQISELIEATAGKLGYMVYESSVLLKGQNSQIIVKIDSLTGISHQDCENFSRELGAMLEDGEVLPNYSLEVSSPGLNRLLRNSGEFSRFLGSPAKVIYQDGADRTFFKGKIEAVTDAAVTLSSDKEEMTITFETIINANLDY